MPLGASQRMMFEQNEKNAPGPSPLAAAASFCLHAVAVAILLYHPAPMVLQPSVAVRGDGGGSRVTTLAYIAPGATISQTAQDSEDEIRNDRLTVPRQPRKRKVRKSETPKPGPTVTAESVVSSKELRPGSPGFVLGSAAFGFSSDHDVRIALPVVAPDPPVIRSGLPDWIRGDVIVEVTINEKGSVTETKILSAVGFGVEQKIVETLLQWRFTPATYDGLPVASRQDVRFHFPA